MEKHCQENEKKSHKIRENICEKPFFKDTCSKYSKIWLNLISKSVRWLQAEKNSWKSSTPQDMKTCKEVYKYTAICAIREMQVRQH